VLLYLGRLHPKKGLPNLLRAWADVFGASLPAPWVLAVAGWDEGGHEAELQRLCGELRLRSADMRTAGAAQLGAGSVLFLGPQFNAAKVACYAACDAFVLPSFSEGLPMAVLEAWAYGKPVLMTPECNLPEGFAANAAIRIATDRDSIAGGLRELFGASPAALGAFATNGRDLVSRKFAWPQIAGEMREVIAWLDRGGARPACVSTV
jgi:poly(glycerol-phosphate) alpha-glucosyltransferase